MKLQKNSSSTPDSSTSAALQMILWYLPYPDHFPALIMFSILEHFLKNYFPKDTFFSRMLDVLCSIPKMVYSFGNQICIILQWKATGTK